MSHVMLIGGGLDHAFENCPLLQREVAANPDVGLRIDPDYEWGLDINFPWETKPFGLCGWCWRVYLARRPLTKALIKHGVWEPHPEAFAGFAFQLNVHTPGAEAPVYWQGTTVSP